MTDTRRVTEPSEPVIEARGLHFRAGASHILRGIDLAVEHGEVVALLGANGSGKSTLVKSLVGINVPSEGTVRLLGEPLGAGGRGGRVDWGRIGYVPQRSGAGGGIPSTAQEVVASGLLHGRRLRLPRGWRQRVAVALEQVSLADRYALEQVGISQLDPEAEPSPARLREIGDVVKENGVTTLYSETLVSPKVTETLASDLGVRTAVLDPLEGLSEDATAAGDDYVSVMQANLKALEEGLVCA